MESGALSPIDVNCTVLVYTEGTTTVKSEDVIKQLETRDESCQIEGMKQAIMLMMSGEQIPKIFMTIVRYCLNTENHTLRKLLMLYWEIMPKLGLDGKLRPEMILTCHAFRNNLTHPNEFLRGCMLRFLCKVTELEILDPLSPAIKSCLTHRHAFVRRNAVLCCLHVYTISNTKIMPDAPDAIEKMIKNETDASTRKNCFLLLFSHAQHHAIHFLTTHAEDVKRFGDGFCLLVLSLSRMNSDSTIVKSLFVRVILDLLSSTSTISPAVLFDCASTLIKLSPNSQSALRSAISSLTRLLASTGDNNVRLVILDRLEGLKTNQWTSDDGPVSSSSSMRRVLSEYVLEVLHLIQDEFVSFDVAKRVLDYSLDLISIKNIEPISILFNRLASTASVEVKREIITKLPQLTKFSDYLNDILFSLLPFGEVEVLSIIKTIISSSSSSTSNLLSSLQSSMSELVTSDGYASALYLLGRYSHLIDIGFVTKSFEVVKSLIGDDINSTATEVKQADPIVTMARRTRNIILKDGTYATITEEVPVGVKQSSSSSSSSLQSLIRDGNIHLATIACVTLTKLTLHAMNMTSSLSPSIKALQVSSLLLLCSLVKNKKISSSMLIRVQECIRLLLDDDYRSGMAAWWTADDDKTSVTHSSSSSSSMKLVSKFDKKKQKKTTSASTARQEVDEVIQFRFLSCVKPVDDDVAKKPLIDENVTLASVGLTAAKTATSLVNLLDSSNRQHIHQMTGVYDPVYVEALLTIHDYDVILDVCITNRTASTLTNLTLELATMGGDVRIVDRPQSFTIGSFDTRLTRIHIKVGSTDSAHVFGMLVYDNSSNAQKSYIPIHNIHIDVMDYISPSWCLEEEFRRMWSDFEWENRVAVSYQSSPSTAAASHQELVEFLDFIIEKTNMQCLSCKSSNSTANAAINTSCFLAANLYATSVFNEDALVNVSVEKREEGRMVGCLRIRSKTQGIALSLGGRITSVQRLWRPSSNSNIE